MSNFSEQLIQILLSVCIVVFGNTTSSVPQVKEKPKEESLMTIQIDKIDLVNKIYKKNSKQNDIDKNVIILDDSDYPDKENGTVLIGGHSGTGSLAYFKRLNELELNDEIKLFFENKEYVYKINNISKDTKDGRIRIDYSSKENRLILYTCNPDDKDTYLVISALR
jgi:LPXTG-site transpeptidase (sortase) family protein